MRPLAVGLALSLSCLLVGCGGAGPVVESGGVESDAARDDESARLVAEAIAVWQRGAAAIALEADETADDEEVTLDEIEWDLIGQPPAQPFEAFDQIVRAFLDAPSVHDAVQFGCARMMLPVEEWITAGLDHADAIVRLRALVVLMRVRAPESIVEQWQVLQELKSKAHGDRFAAVTALLDEAFAAESVAPLIEGAMPNGRFYTAPAKLQWALRAAGVAQHAQFLPRLAQWSCSNGISVSLAATASLREFEGHEADLALAQCVRGWQYNGSGWAANTLLDRDPELLRRTLKAMSPTDRRYLKGLLLARLDDPGSVPILCETVHEMALVDGEMFDGIERLATATDLDRVAQLPEHVREEQRERAKAVLAAVRARLKDER